MLDLGGADAESQCRQSTVRGGMRVAANDAHAGQGKPLFRPDHVHDPLTDVAHLELADTKACAVVIQGFELQARDWIVDSRPVGGWNIVIGNREIRVYAPRFSACDP